MALLALLQTDYTTSTPSANALAGMGAGIIAFAMIFGLAIFAFFIFLLWRIFTKAGFSGAMSLLVLVPGVGGIIALCILAFGEWKVVPAVAANTYGGPPNPYPPNAFPPSPYGQQQLPPTQSYPSYGQGGSNYPPSSGQI